MANDDKYKRAVTIAARDIKKLRTTVQVQSAVIAALTTAVLLIAAVKRKERVYDPP
jgi:hypothetical protein